MTPDLVYGRRAVREALRGHRQVLEIWATERALKAEDWLGEAHPKAKPDHSDQSIPTAAKTAGSTMPHPPNSIQPVCEHVRHPLPPQTWQVTSNSADGSVKGKKPGRSRE